MYAVIRTGGKQYRVAPEDILNVEKISGDVGEIVQFPEVLMISGEGDAKAAAIYAAAYNADPEFYSFVRSLNAYQSTFSNKADIMLIDPDNKFFRFLNDAQGESN